MNDSPKRRFWQIHLSTAIVLMFVAGGLIGLNCFPVVTDSRMKSFEGLESIVTTSTFGWPWNSFEEKRTGTYIISTYVDWDGVALNGAVMLFAIAACWFLSEYLVHSR